MRRPSTRSIHGARNLRSLPVDRTEFSALFGVTNNDERPVLRIACRWCTDCGIENLGDDRFRHRVGLEFTQRASAVNCLKHSEFHLHTSSQRPLGKVAEYCMAERARTIRRKYLASIRVWPDRKIPEFPLRYAGRAYTLPIVEGLCKRHLSWFK